MYLIVWLGNPWAEYEKTRHNLGFIFLDYFRKENNFSDFKFESKLKGKVSEGIFLKEKTILLKPETYMNLSGESIKRVTDFYKIPKENLIVVFDDISMDFWKIRFRPSGTAGWHNGLKSIIQYFWEEFNRVKFWVGENKNYETSDWVLSKFTKQELWEILKLFPNIEQTISATFIENRAKK